MLVSDFAVAWGFRQIVAGALCVKWKMNILVAFCINFATREAGCHSVFQAWNVRQICQQSHRTRACRMSRHKLAHCEHAHSTRPAGWRLCSTYNIRQLSDASSVRDCKGLATFGNRELCCINHCICLYMHQTLAVVKRDYENCCPHGLLFINKALKCGEVRMLMTPFLESRALSKFKQESTGQRS